MATPDEHVEGKFLHQVQFPVRWGDMDALGHINNIVYFQYFEIARLQWYEQSGFSPLGSATQGMVVADNHAQYLKAVVYPANVCVKMFGHSPGRSSFTSTYTLTVNDELFTTGAARIVWVDTAIGKSVPLPDTVRTMVQ